MVWYKDLSHFDHFGDKISKLICGEDPPKKLKAVGWLEKGKPYSTGPTLPDVVEKLREFWDAREFRMAFLGVHQCDFCDSQLIDGFGSITSFVAYENKIYVFPDLIIHYIEKHDYLPPAEFVEALLSSNPQKTLEYFLEIRENKLT